MLSAMQRRGIDGFEDDIARQLVLIGDRTPSYRRILVHVQSILREPASPIARAFARAWQHRSFDTYYERPLLTQASLRHDALLEGPSHPLWSAIAAQTPSPKSASEERVREAMAPERLGFWMTARTRRVQTNETSRAVTWLWPAALAARRARRKLALVDIGCSAGLNLVAEAVDHDWRDASGTPLPTARDAQIVSRLGFDTRPLDASNADDVRWLVACVWPGETARLRALEQAVAAFGVAEPRPEIVVSTASTVPHRLLQIVRALPEDTSLLVYQTLVQGYLPANERESYLGGMRELVRQTSPRRVLWTSLEIGDETDPISPATLSATLQIADQVQSLPLARTGYHPTVLDVNAPAVAELERALSA